MTYFLPKQFPPIQASDLTPSVENACGDHQGGLNGYRASLWHNQELKFINSFYCLILLFCGAQSQISYSRPYKVNFIFATLCLRSACSLLLGRSNIKCAFDYFNLSLTGSSHSWICWYKYHSANLLNWRETKDNATWGLGENEKLLISEIGTTLIRPAK